MELENKLELSNEVIAITQGEINKYWSQLSLDNEFKELESLKIVEAVFLSHIGQKETDKLEFLNGGWTINVKGGIAKSAVGYAVMAGVLTLAGVTNGLALAVLPSILPFLFEIEKVDLNRREKFILAQLHLKKDVREQMHSPEQLYNLLPQDIQDQLNFLDFQDFLDKIDLAGYKDTYTEKVFRLSENAKFKLSYK